MFRIRVFVIALKVEFYISTIAFKHGGDMTESSGGGGGGGGG